MINKLIRYFAIEKGMFTSIWLKMFSPSNEDFIEHLKRNKKFHSIGKGCHINKDVCVTNPPYVRIGSNVCLSSCTLIGHDAVISVLNKAYNKKLDSVGKIDIKDNVFIGMGAIILPNCIIGPNSIVAAGAVVTSNVPAGKIVGGVPAKVIGDTDELVKKLDKDTKKLPWYDLIESREGAYDSNIEEELIRQRVNYFFPKEKD